MTLLDEGRRRQYINVLIGAYWVGFNSGLTPPVLWCGQSTLVIGRWTSLADTPHQHVWNQLFFAEERKREKNPCMLCNEREKITAIDVSMYNLVDQNGRESLKKRLRRIECF